MKTKTTRDPETGELTISKKELRKLSPSLADMMENEHLELPDSEATVEQVTRYCDLDWKEAKPNYWKYACVAILLGTVAGMISLTPKIIEVIDVCIQ